MVEDTSDTVAIGGTEYPFDSLQSAFESYDGKTTKRGPVILTPDGYDDTDILVVNLDAGTYRHLPEHVIDEALEGASEQSFVEYVRENVTLTEHEYVQPRGNNAMIVDGLNYSITISTFRDIQGDDGIRILSIQYSDVQDELIVRLKDTREGQ